MANNFLSYIIGILIFFSVWYDTTWDWTPVFRIIGEHSTHLVNSTPTHSYIVFDNCFCYIVIIIWSQVTISVQKLSFVQFYDSR